MIKPTDIAFKFSENNLEHFFDKLIAVDEELEEHFSNYLSNEYEGKVLPFEISKGPIAENDIEFKGRNCYLEIAEIARFITQKFETNQTRSFRAFFDNVEKILDNSDDYVVDLLVYGLFEGIQNIGGYSSDYHFGYNKWLGPNSQLKWNSLIDSWEGTAWRQKN